jgi:Fuc2NAc and GlcNAc transferase
VNISPLYLLLPAYLLIILVSWAITGTIRRFAISNAILDYPNHRSLHVHATPRGGGLAIAGIMLFSITALYLAGQLRLDYLLGIGGGMLLVSVIGWIDDWRGLPAHWRGLGYLLSAIWASCWIAGIPDTMRFYGLIYFLISVTGITWLVNLYNFMDGIDGLAGSQAVITSSMGAFLLYQANDWSQAQLMFVLSASAAGFLIWNWPRARIFMGDTGSCLIGFVFGATALVSDTHETVPLTAWLILLSLFICDTTLTLVKRILSGEAWYQAHRQHAYQKLIQMGMSHKQLTCAVISVNLVILLPVAYLTTIAQSFEWLLTGGIYLAAGVGWLLVQLKFRTYIHGNKAG